MTIHETMLSTFAEICAELAVRGSYTGAAVASLTEQVCWENLFHEIRDRAEPVYAFDTNGLLSDALKYRGQKLFDCNARTFRPKGELRRRLRRKPRPQGRYPGQIE